MIIGMERPREVGKLYKGLGDFHGKVHDQPYVILRESTYDEWRDFYLSIGGSEHERCWSPSAFFYLIHTD